MNYSWEKNAEEDFFDVIRRYEGISDGLGLRFADLVDKTMALVQVFPETFPVIYRDVRKIALLKFPYKILYRIINNEIKIIAIFHFKENK